MNCLTPECRDDLRKVAGVAVRLAIVAAVGFLVVYGRDFYDLLYFSYVLNQIP